MTSIFYLRRLLCLCSLFLFSMVPGSVRSLVEKEGHKSVSNFCTCHMYVQDVCTVSTSTAARTYIEKKGKCKNALRFVLTFFNFFFVFIFDVGFLFCTFASAEVTSCFQQREDLIFDLRIYLSRCNYRSCLLCISILALFAINIDTFLLQVKDKQSFG